MEFYLDKVTISKKDILYRLLMYSLFEESEFDLNEMNEDGLFEYNDFNLYFNNIDKDAYFIREKETNKLLGFVMINTNMKKYQNGHNIEEFMIIPKYRRKGLGRKVSLMIFDLYKGNFEVSPSFGSKKAFNFWESVIKEYTNNNYKYIDGIFMFNN